MWDRLARFIVRRPVTVVIVTLVLAGACAVGLKGLEFRTSQDTLVSSTSQVYKDNARYQAQFGGESMIVLLTGDAVGLFSPSNVASLQRLEAELRITPGVTSVVGPYAAMQYATDQLKVAPSLLLAAAGRAPDASAYNAYL